MSVSTPRRVPRLAALAALSFVLLILLGAGSKAHAGYDQWSCTLPSGTVGCSDDRHSLVAVSVWSEASSRLMGAGASTTGRGSDAVGSYAWGYGYTCRAYLGSSVLYPLLGNGSTVPLTLNGLSSYGAGSESC